MKRIPFFLFAIIPLAFPAAGRGAARDEIQSTQEGWVAALSRHDAAAVAAFLHPLFTGITADDEEPQDLSGFPLENRVAAFARYFSRYDIWSMRQVTAVYQAAGETGTATGIASVTRKLKDGVQGAIRWRYSNTWVRTDGKWLLLSSHMSLPGGAVEGGRPQPKDETEKRILGVALGTPRFANVPLTDARLLRILAEFSGAKNVVEVGTSTGFSGLWFLTALRRTAGRLTTFEIDPRRAATAQQRFKEAGVADLAQVVLGDAHENVKKLEGPIDIAFIDAEKPGYLDYLEKLLPLIRPGGLIVSHNMRWPAPSPEFVKAITTDPALETMFVNMDDQGIGLTLKKR